MRAHLGARTTNPPSSHHPRAESRQLSVGSGVVPCVPKGNRTVVNFKDFPAIPELLGNRADAPLLCVEQPQNSDSVSLAITEPVAIRRRTRRSSRRAQSVTGAESSPGRQHGSAKRAAQDATIGNFTSVISAGANLRNDRRTRRVKAFRHGLMRHFLIRKVGEPIAVARLPGRLEP